MLAATLAGGWHGGFGAAVPTRVRGSGADSRRGREGDRRGQPAVRHLPRHRLCRRRGPGLRVGRQHRLAADRRAGQLPPHDQLRHPHDRRGVRPQTGAQPGVLEVRSRLAGWHAGPEEPASDVHRQRRLRLAHRRRGRHAGADVARRRLDRPARDLDEPARVHQGRAAARRQPEGGVAVGAGRDGARRSDDGARQDARGVDFVRQIPHRRHRQQAEPDSAHPHDGGGAGAGRFQLRARVHRSADLRQREVSDRLALAPGLGRQLRLRERDRRPQRVRRHLPDRRTERLRSGDHGAGCGARAPPRPHQP